ncbi:uncharacterized protein MELLADRAFT_68438 [Melampsora larici-populina 98AG31]|uniref:Uncharacterized protein n=1 Tax=Melampsora larici-populina (strain 98AG31 / pathotype 3-4-7) TaxID=747676 RepID=F4S6U0_MELLP|nr:uncharacterized protein MELLADRAFT_68438 [Melampsora larici-populina 98AG31]EGF99632.1 hypothetical protein MELLADRAFT_68438 [Melampsora larici-populina 98AG31]
MPPGCFGHRRSTADMATDFRPNSSESGDTAKHPSPPVSRRPSTSIPSTDPKMPAWCQQCTITSDRPFVHLGLCLTQVLALSGYVTPGNPDESCDLSRERWDSSSMRGQQPTQCPHNTPVASLSIKTNMGVISWDERRARARALAQITHDLPDPRLMLLRPSNSQSSPLSSPEIRSRQPSNNSNWTHDSEETSGGSVLHSPTSNILVSSPIRSSRAQHISLVNNQSSKAMESLNAFSDEEEKVRFVQRETFLERYEKQRHTSFVESLENPEALIPSTENLTTSFTTNFRRAICKNLSARPGSRNGMKYFPIKPSKPRAASTLSHSTGDTSLPIEIVKTVSVIVEDNGVTSNPPPSSGPLINTPCDSTPLEPAISDSTSGRSANTF